MKNKKRLNYFQVHLNKTPRTNKELKLLRFEKYLNNLAVSASRSLDSLMSFQYSLAEGAGKIGQIIVFVDSPGGSI